MHKSVSFTLKINAFLSTELKKVTHFFHKNICRIEIRPIFAPR